MPTLLCAGLWPDVSPGVETARRYPLAYEHSHVPLPSSTLTLNLTLLWLVLFRSRRSSVRRYRLEQTSGTRGQVQPQEVGGFAQFLSGPEIPQFDPARELDLALSRHIIPIEEINEFATVHTGAANGELFVFEPGSATGGRK